MPGVTLGAAVVAIHSRHPIVMSSQAQTAQVAVGGRLQLGLGVGHRPTVEDRYGIPFDRPVLRMREYLESLQPLLTDGAVTFHGDTLRADTSGWSARVPGSAPPPVLIAAMGPRMLRLAAELADGTITWLAGVRSVAERIRPGLATATRTPQLIAGLPVCLTDDPQAARARAARNLAFYAAVPTYRRVLDWEGAASAADVALVGDEAELDRQLARLRDAGATRLLANLSGITTEAERVRTLEYLGSRSVAA